jgi:hypothetical protein
MLFCLKSLIKTYYFSQKVTKHTIYGRTGGLAPSCRPPPFRRTCSYRIVISISGKIYKSICLVKTVTFKISRVCFDHMGE